MCIRDRTIVKHFNDFRLSFGINHIVLNIPVNNNVHSRIIVSLALVPEESQELPTRITQWASCHVVLILHAADTRSLTGPWVCGQHCAVKGVT